VPFLFAASYSRVPMPSGGGLAIKSSVPKTHHSPQDLLVAQPSFDPSWVKRAALGRSRSCRFLRPCYTRVRMSVLENIAAIAKGMSITFKEMFQPTIVENYPDGPGPLRGAKFQERYRGVHVLQRDENGLEKCVACFLCAANCPANCIYIEAAENTAEHRVSGAERYAKVYNIDYNRCIFCGYCVEACPTDAITHGHGFELATFNATNLVYRKEQLLAARPAHLGANPVFNTAEVIGGAPADVAPGE
jgi:NADH-quinone oxidoreductase subunit I